MSAPHRIRPLGLAGELLITAGVLVLLFLGWQTGWNNWVLGVRQSGSAADVGGRLLRQAPPEPVPTASGTPAAPLIPVENPPARAGIVGVMYVPRFGAGWKRTIRQGTDDGVLASSDAGIGHYDGTAMPGAVGNFAVAAHDTGYGNTFLQLQNLRLGDLVYVQTRDGFYTYAFRDEEYVQPTAVDVLLPVPRDRGAVASDRLITLTTCNPPWHAVERLIAYGVLQSFSPTPPPVIADQVGTH